MGVKPEDIERAIREGNKFMAQLRKECPAQTKAGTLLGDFVATPKTEGDLHAYPQRVRAYAGKRIRQDTKPLLNRLESQWLTWFQGNYSTPVIAQSITLRLDPPFTSYRPDFAYLDRGLVLVEVKGPHRFREKGIAKAALAAKTYPMFQFVLFEKRDGEWKSTILSA